MLLCGILMGFVALVAEIKGSRKSKVTQSIEMEVKGEEDNHSMKSTPSVCDINLSYDKS